MAKRFYDIVHRIKLHRDYAFVVQLRKLAIDIKIVDFSGAGLMPPGNVGDMNQADLGNVLLELFDKVPELPLLVIDVVKHFDVGTAHGFDNLKGLRHSIKIDGGILNAVDGLNHRRQAGAA